MHAIQRDNRNDRKDGDAMTRIHSYARGKPAIDKARSEATGVPVEALPEWSDTKYTVAAFWAPTEIWLDCPGAQYDDRPAARSDDYEMGR